MKEFIEKFNIEPKGVIHIGAHWGGEISIYNTLGFKRVVFVEPLSKTFAILKDTVEKNNKDEDCEVLLINKAMGNEKGEIEMYVEVSNQGQSSSILKPKFHLQQYPGIVFTHKEKVEISTLNDEVKNNESLYNVLNIDVQGYELEVLKGSTNLLPHVDIINTEVNRIEMYEGCPLINEIDEFLSSFGFIKIDENWMGHYWGDAIYLKKRFLS